MKKRNAIRIAIGGVALALLALLVYSFERTSWLFGLFEQWTPAAQSAAAVVELSAVALIASAGAIAHMDKDARAWANRALLSVLSTQALANLAAGYLRGGRATLALFGGPADYAAYAVAATLWLVSNMAVPALILCLSKLLERLIDALVRLPIDTPAVRPTTRLTPALAQETDEHPIRVSVPAPIVADRACPNCGRGLSAGKYGAAIRWGYCKECK